MARQSTPAATWDEFLETLGNTANVRKSAAAAGISSRTAYRRRARDPDFAERWDDAIADALAQLEARVFNAAREGDMQSARWLLARRLPAIYGEQVALEHSGGDERSISVTPAREVIMPDIPEETVESLESLDERSISVTPAREVIIREVIMPDIPEETAEVELSPRVLEWLRKFTLFVAVWLGWTMRGCVS